MIEQQKPVPQATGVPQRVMRKAHVAKTLGLSLSTLDRLRHDPLSGFPAPIRLGQQAIGWLVADIESFIASRPRVTLH
ncbi:AlpA family transcriptional regulator [Hydrogenophaga sp.]|uniref:helix-turn-helix transcriptional regulator n=1 Tax=Hydrogenophaga sp. TaxID=1904254 RepID=UPI002722E4A4|nr:AlpA family phage regulatory protein [Hydrogenophaga sp.]MDO9504780.1 AlpA family phage regulatory protein [Hydrogenophaga sp.]